jgi:tRNA 2-thiouridine synthesizing protein E
VSTFTFRGKTYQVSWEGFLLDPGQWDQDFAEGMAPKAGISPGLTEEHWDVIRYIRDTFEEQGICPPVYQTCRAKGLHLKDLQRLFPSGYQRGACKLAGITYKEGYLEHSWLPKPAEELSTVPPEKVYHVDVRGFLVDAEEWDEQFAAAKAFEMKVPGKLTDRHWQIIYFLRNSYRNNDAVPTIYETCEANHLEIEELERLFPDGYHRGAVKIAGLRAR